MRKTMLLLLLLSMQLTAQEIAVQKGAVTNGLKVSDSLEESFSVYLPKDFQGERQWPVIFVFDSKGRGGTAIHLFTNAAEEQGYIIASSNTVQSDKDIVKNAESAVRLFNAVVGMFPVDSRQIATAGSMEGAKVATSMPLLYKDLLGAIAVGNYWVNYKRLDKKNRFSFIAMVGDEHYTAASIRNTAEILDRLRFPTQVYTFEGEAEWPQPQMLSSAVGSLTLEAMRQGVRSKDPSLIEKLYQQDMGLVNEMISKVKLVDAYAFLELMEDKYDELRSLDEVEDKMRHIRGSRNFKEQARELEDVLEKERRLLDEFIYYLEEDIQRRNFENLGWWNYQKQELDSLSSKGGAEAKMAIRMKSLLNELADTYDQTLREEHAPLEKQLLANMIQTIFDPNDYQAYKNIISLSAQDSDFGTALFYLEEMLKHGYDDMEALYDIEGTLGLKLTAEYNALIEKYLGSSKFYDEQ